MQTLTITPYERQFREPTLNLVHYTQWAHRHLDWYRTGDWLDHEASITRLAWSGDTLVGMISLSKPFNQSRWIRLLAVREDRNVTKVIQSLWEQVYQELQAETSTTLSILVTHTWLTPYLPSLGFQYREEVITLQRISRRIDAPPQSPATIRVMNPEDLPIIQTIDRTAFSPPWQMTRDEIRQAYRLSSNVTVAMLDRMIVGYQMSTRHRGSGHLARIGVHPDMQGQQIGGLILHDLIQRFKKRGVYNITVNTQETNYASQRLYQRYKFRRNGFDLSVWEQQL